MNSNVNCSICVCKALNCDTSDFRVIGTLQFKKRDGGPSHPGIVEAAIIHKRITLKIYVTVRFF